MASLGSLVIELAANTARMQSDLGKAVNIAQSASNKMTAAFRTVAGVAGIGAIGFGIQQVFGGLIKNSTEAQESMNRLEQAVRRTGNTAGVSVSYIADLASKIQSVSKFSDEAVTDAASSLLLFDKITGNTFERALQDSADLAAVMKTDVPEAAAALGKALQLPGEGLRVLAQAGIKFNDEQIKTLQYMTETGRAAEAQAIILGELEKRTNGAAAATKNTLGGAFSGLINQLGELAEAPGFIDKMATSVNGFSAAVERLRNSPFGQATGGVLSYIAKINSDIGQAAIDVGKAALFPLDAIRGNGVFAPEQVKRRQAPASAVARSGGFQQDVLAQETARREAAEKAAKDAANAKDKELADVRVTGFKIATSAMDKYYSDLIEESRTATQQSAANELREYTNKILAVEELGKQRILSAQQVADQLAAIDAEYNHENQMQSQETVDKMSIYADQAARNMQSAFAEFLFDPFKDGLKGMLKGFIDTIRRMIAEAAAADIFGAITGKGGGNLSAIFKGVGKLFGGFKAAGGPVSGGTSYLVGERGPELFTPGSSGSITPNNRLGGGMVFAPVYNIDARGATMELTRALPGILKANSEATEARIVQRLRRNYYG